MMSFITGPIGKLLGGAMILIALWGGFKIWLLNHDKAVLEGYVVLSEKTAADAKAKEQERQKLVAEQSLTEAKKRATAAEKLKDDANAELARRIAEDTDDGCGWTDLDSSKFLPHN